MSKIIVVGEGVAGLSTALAIQKALPKTKLTVQSAAPFDTTCSYGPGGLFRIENANAQKHKKYGVKTFSWLEEVYKNFSGEQSGVKLISGHIQSDNRDTLEQQERAYGDIVYNFRWLNDKEMDQFVNPSKYCIHYTAFATEGSKYVPFLKSQLKDVQFVQKKVYNLEELGKDYDVVVNCAGVNGGKLAGDDDTSYPIRGIVVEIVAPWHKHFLYRDFNCFSIPKHDVIAIGSVREKDNFNPVASDEEAQGILDRYCQLHPAMKGAKIVNKWCNFRPARDDGIRLEKVDKTTANGKKYTVVHNYGHASGGFTLGWGTALEVVDIIKTITTTCRF